MHRKRCRGYNIPGHAHFLTFSCFRRLPLLSRERSRQWFMDSLQSNCRRHDFTCWAYVLMPEHVHLLIDPRQTDYNVSEFLRSLNLDVTRPAMRFCKRHAPHFLKQLEDRQPNGKRTYRFWQRGRGMDLNLWTDAKIWDKIEYIHNNPIRRKLVARPEEWFWSSYRDFAGIGRGSVLLDGVDLPADARM